MTLVVEVRRPLRAGTVVVEVRGDCDALGAGTLREHLERQVDAGRRHVVVDLTRLTFVDSTGLGVLVGARRSLAARGARMDLVVDHGPVHRVLRISALTQLFTVRATVEEALRVGDPP